MDSHIGNTGERMPTVSVIIPTYNRPTFLRRAILSVLNQTYRDLELVVVENGESNCARAVVDELAVDDSRIKYVYLEDASVSLARNKGIEVSTGNYIAFLDDDDEWLPEKLTKQVSLLEENTNIGLVTCRMSYVDGDGNLTKEVSDYEDEITLKVLVEKGNVIWSCSNVVIRRECFKRVGTFNTAYRIVQDYELYLRIAGEYSIFCIQEPLVRYNRHESNLTNDFSSMTEETIQTLRASRFKFRKDVNKGVIQNGITRLYRSYYNNAVDMCNEGKYGKAVRYFYRAVCLNPAVGLDIKWGRFKNPLYRLIRPYVALCYYSVKAVFNLCLNSRDTSSGSTLSVQSKKK